MGQLYIMPFADVQDVPPNLPDFKSNTHTKGTVNAIQKVITSS